MDDADLAAYQEALVSAFVTGRDAADVKRRLLSSTAARSYAAYVGRFEPRVVDLQAALARHWCRRESEPTKLDALARGQVARAFSWRVRSTSAATVPLVRARWVRDWLRASADLPAIAPRTIARERIDAWRYYDIATLAYARPLDLLADAGLDSIHGKRLLELAYRSVLPHRMLGSIGALCVATSTDPWKRRLHADVFEHPTRALRLVPGALSSSEETRRVGGPFDVVLGWNAVAREPSLGGGDLPATLASLVKDGALVLLYDAAASPRETRARVPLTRRVWERAGFRAIAFDRDDSRTFRAMANALDWPEAVEARARYSLFRRA